MRGSPPRAYSYAAVIGLALSAVSSRASSQAPPQRPPLVFLADPDLSMDPGARTTTSLARILYRYDEVLRDEPNVEAPDDRVLGVLSRTLKVALIDAPIAAAAITFQHEVYGHGGRAREQGLSPTYQFRLVEPYRTLFGQDGALAGEAFFERQDQVDRDLALVTGGIEADYRTAYWINRDLVSHDGWTHYGDMLMYALARLSYASSLLSPADHGDSSDDVHNYVGMLQRRFNRWTDTERSSIQSRLRTAYVWNLLDPTLLFAGYALVDHVVEGTRFVQAPLPSVRGVKFLPWPSFALSPFGAEHGLTVFLERSGTVVDIEGRVGSSGLAAYGGAGIHASGIEAGEFVKIGAGVDAWTQPEMLFDERNVFDRPNRVGGSVGTEGTFALSPQMGFVMSLAYKTRGFLPGRPLDRGMYGYAGLSWNAP